MMLRNDVVSNTAEYLVNTAVGMTSNDKLAAVGCCGPQLITALAFAGFHALQTTMLSHIIRTP